MTFTPEQIKALKAPLDPRYVKPAPQGKYGEYVEGWHVIAEANRIFGFESWESKTDLTLIGEREVNGKWRVDYRARCTITVHTSDHVVERDGCGFGQGIDKDLGQAHESALKEAETDARKRAFMTFGNPFGLALYDKTKANVQAPPPETLSDAQREKLAEYMNGLNFPADRLLSVSKIKDLRELPAAKFDGAMKWIADEAKKLENA